MTAQDLRKAEAAHQAAFRRYEQAREARNTLVLAALAQGWTHARIAEATGLTRGRIGQIALLPAARRDRVRPGAGVAG